MTPTQHSLARIAAQHGSAYATRGTDGERHWQDMAEAGLAVQMPHDGGQVRYALTEAGAAMVQP